MLRTTGVQDGRLCDSQDLSNVYNSSLSCTIGRDSYPVEDPRQAPMGHSTDLFRNQWVAVGCSGVVAHPPLGGQIYIKAPPPPPPPQKKKASAHIHVYMSIHRILITKCIYNLQRNCHGHFHVQLKENGGRVKCSCPTNTLELQ